MSIFYGKQVEILDSVSIGLLLSSQNPRRLLETVQIILTLSVLKRNILTTAVEYVVPAQRWVLQKRVGERGYKFDKNERNPF